jgi:heme/copper-type cytochrome/quinol oxidase subunit 2
MQIDSHVNHMGMGTVVPIDIVLGGVSMMRSVEIQESRNSLPNVSFEDSCTCEISLTAQKLWLSIFLHVFAFDTYAHPYSQKSKHRHAHKA